MKTRTLHALGTLRERCNQNERGAVVILAAFTLMAMIATAAVVVDIAAARRDRSASQISADAAAAAAGLELGFVGSVEACDVAFSYLEANLNDTLTGNDCSMIPVDCTDLTVPVEVTRSLPGLTATIVHPVGDTHGSMQSSAAGSPDSPLFDIDGVACDRIAVELVRDRQVFFGGFMGTRDATTTVHAVSLAVIDELKRRPIHLLLLNRTECDVISVNGTGSGGGLYVRSSTDPETGIEYPGFIASDSDGSESCSNKGIINVTGNGATIQADGAAGCDGELVSGTGAGCGSIDVYAVTGSTCEMPACSSSGVLNPMPSSIPRRITRARVDHKYNCKSSYDTDIGIGGCRETGTQEPWIDQLAYELGRLYPPIGYLDYRAEGYPCSINGGPTTSVTIPEGNWWIDCGDLNVKRELIFEGGNIVLTGDLTVQAGGSLEVNAANTEVYDWSYGEPFDPYESSAGAAVIALQSGDFKKASGAEVRLNNTMMYLGDGAELTFTAGNGTMTWTAPTEGPFADLAMWSESSEDLKFAGSSALALTGVFFAPESAISYQGNGTNHSVEAQFIADKLSMGGNGGLELNPVFDRMVLFDADADTGLIR